MKSAKTLCSAKSSPGFLLLSFLLVLTILLSMVTLSLTRARWLWRASRFELRHSELANAQRAALNQLSTLLRHGKIPPSCWHTSSAPWQSVADFTQNPRLGCHLTSAGAEHFYWLEVLGYSTSTPPLGFVIVRYQLLLTTEQAGQVWQNAYYGYALKPA